jgi:hypothetical protein
LITVAARVDVHLSTTEDFHGCPGNVTIRCGGDLVSYPEQELEEEPGPRPPNPKKDITPSLATLERAVFARRFFENLYFTPLRQSPSQEQRRLAMERDVLGMGLPEA